MKDLLESPGYGGTNAIRAVLYSRSGQQEIGQEGSAYIEFLRWQNCSGQISRVTIGRISSPELGMVSVIGRFPA